MAFALTRVAGRVQDERKRAEVALDRVIQSERRIADTFHLSPSPLALANLSTGRVTEVNATYLKLMGRTRDELLGAPVADLGIASRPSAALLIPRLRRSGLVRDYSTRIDAAMAAPAMS